MSDVKVDIDASESEGKLIPNRNSCKVEDTSTQKRKRSESQTEQAEEASHHNIPETPGSESDVDSDATNEDVNGAGFW